MLEIDKLKQRLKNIQRGVIEYRMTVIEAQALVKEFDSMQQQLKDRPVITKTVTVEIAAPKPHIIDGGSL